MENHASNLDMVDIIRRNKIESHASLNYRILYYNTNYKLYLYQKEVIL